MVVHVPDQDEILGTVDAGRCRCASSCNATSHEPTRRPTAPPRPPTRSSHGFLRNLHVPTVARLRAPHWLCTLLQRCGPLPRLLRRALVARRRPRATRPRCSSAPRRALPVPHQPWMPARSHTSQVARRVGASKRLSPSGSGSETHQEVSEARPKFSHGHDFRFRKFLKRRKIISSSRAQKVSEAKSLIFS